LRRKVEAASKRMTKEPKRCQTKDNTRKRRDKARTTTIYTTTST
jgi:hypothetical protein